MAPGNPGRLLKFRQGASASGYVGEDAAPTKSALLPLGITNRPEHAR